MNTHPCPNTAYTTSEETCAIFSNLHVDTYMIHSSTVSGRVTTTERKVTPGQFWKFEKDGSNNRCTLFKVSSGRFLIGRNGGSSQIAFWTSADNLDDRFWTLDEQFHCLN